MNRILWMLFVLLALCGSARAQLQPGGGLPQPVIPGACLVGATASAAEWLSCSGSAGVVSVGLGVPGSSIFGVTGSPVTTSGTLGLTVTGTSGGVPYFDTTSTIKSSSALAANRIVLGGGAGAAPATLASLGTTTTVLHGNAAGAPTFGAVDLANDVTGNLTVTHLNGGTGASSSTFWRGDGTWAAASGGSGCTTSGSNGQLLTDNGAGGCTSNTTGTGVLAALGNNTNAAGGVGTVGTSGATVGLLNAGKTDSGTNSFTGVNRFGTLYGADNQQSGTTYTIDATDCGKTVVVTNSSAITVTAPDSIVAGCRVAVVQGGTGQITIAAGGTATVNGLAGALKTAGQYGGVSLANVGATPADWFVFGGST